MADIAKYFLLGIILATTLQVNSQTEKEIIIDPEAPCNCGELFTSDYGTFNSPGYPSYYPNNLDCIWQINVTPPAVIGVHFADDIFLQHCDSCDYIEIRDGSTADSPLLARFTGHVMPTSIYSTSNSLRIRFRTDSMGTMSGFNATYLAERSSMTPTMPATTTSTWPFPTSTSTLSTSTVKPTISSSTATWSTFSTIMTTTVKPSLPPTTQSTTTAIYEPVGNASNNNNIVINNNNNLFVYILPEYLLKVFPKISNFTSSTAFN